MAKDTMYDGHATGGKHDSDLHAGMKNRACKDGQHGVSPGGHSIDSEACRDSTAPTPGTLGPRRI